MSKKTLDDLGRLYQKNALSDFGELYHDFSFFGVENKQMEVFRQNQKCKEKILRSYIQYAIAHADTERHKNVSFAELFCADGYYALTARRMGASVAYGIDNNMGRHSSRASEIARRLGITDFFFKEMDVNNIHTLEQVDIVANIGGLYHVPNPEDILKKSYAYALRYLIVQTVVSLAGDDPDYFASPAPGWTWGSRYSRRSFEALIAAQGWNIADSYFNELEGNSRPEDRGSLYYLIQKPRNLQTF
jgi:hypothetical protein